MSALEWRADCEHCHWSSEARTRTEAMRLARQHVHDEHDADDEWGFRVRGFRPRATKPVDP